MKNEKYEKLVANLHDKTENLVYIRSLKKTFNHGLALKYLHRVIKFKQTAWIKTFIDANTDFKKAAK